MFVVEPHASAGAVMLAVGGAVPVIGEIKMYWYFRKIKI